jgi:hypothetical protein
MKNEKRNGFKKGNNYGRKATPIPENEKMEIIHHIEEYNIGYTYIRKIWGYSQKKLNDNGIFTRNKKSIKKAEKQLNRVTYEEIKDIWSAEVDGSDITKASLRDANKQKRVINWINENGEKVQIKMYGIFIRKTGYMDIIFKVQKSSGEFKASFAEIIVKNIENVGKHIILDSQSKFNDLKELGITVYHPIKSVKHPHNANAERVFSIVKSVIHRNSEKLENMKLEDALTYLEAIKRITLRYEKVLTITQIETELETEPVNLITVKH